METGLGGKQNTETSRETNLMSDLDLPLLQYNPNSTPEEIDKINIDKLNLDPDYPQEELSQ